MDKTLFLIRGVPGSGKTTLAQALYGSFEGCAIQLSADDFMVNEDDEYQFQPGRLAEVHARCLSATDGAMRNTIVPIIVHNTFTQNWEMKPYFDLAKKYGYSVFVVRCENQFGNVHGVPDAKVQQMVDRFEDRRY